MKRVLGTTIGTSNGTVYLSFLMATSSNAFSGDSLGTFRTIELYNNGVGADDSGGRVYAAGLLRGDGNSNSAQFEQRHYAQANTVSPDLGAFNANTNLFVVKFNFTNSGANYTADAWLNPTNSTDFTSANNRITGTNLNFNAYGLASFADPASGAASFDEIIFTDDLADLNLVPEPSSAALFGILGVLGLLRRRR